MYNIFESLILSNKYLNQSAIISDFLLDKTPDQWYLADWHFA
jgi:hypothetical protein